MAAITSKIQICNLAVSGLGNRNTVNDIDTPKNDKEVQCALWYDITRQLQLKLLMPNFALTRLVVSKKTVPAGYAASYAYAYEKPVRALKVLGVGDIDSKDTNDYLVEGNLILSNTNYESGMTIRIIDDVDDVASMTSEFIIQLAAELRKQIAAAITNDQGKKNDASKDALIAAANTTALNAQENPPIRVSRSRFRQSRQFNMPENPRKP